MATIWKQSNLFGQPLPMNPKNQSLPPDHACDERCFDAEGERCSCKCGGAYHGLGRINSRERKEAR
jgi:hypothetical protein